MITEDHRLLPDQLTEQAAKTPDAIAVSHGDRRLTYRELHSRANRLAHHLIHRGAGSGELVAVVLPRSVDLVVSLLAVLKSGAGYVPISADDPAPRVTHLLADASPVLTITTVGTEHSRVPGAVALDDPGTEAALADCSDLGPSDIDRVKPLQADGVAYVIYTSGSTGQPKGVRIGHSALNRYLAHALAQYPAVAGRTLLHSSVSFDMTVTSLYPPLLTGGSIVVVDLHAALGGAQLPAEQRPTFLKITPSHLAVLRELPDVFSPTEQLVIGGEALTGAALQPWRDAHPDVTVINEYGPTEATVGCCVFALPPGAPADGSVPIGKPTAGTRLHVLDDQLRPVAAGVEGELYIGGSQLAHGYSNRRELTTERFVTDPWGPDGARMYRTGDLVAALPDGNLVYRGRIDEQVKINGYRIEPGEIEVVLLGSGLVGQARVVARDGMLVAYVVADHVVAVDTLREHVAAKLPSYMIPAQFVLLDELPLNPNGKLDTAALESRTAEAPRADISDDQEAVLCDLAATVLGVPIDVNADFIAMGGTSISAARLVTRARKAGLHVTLMDVLRKRTVRAILAGTRSGT